MKKFEAQSYLRLYHRSLAAYAELDAKLKEAQAVADGVPILRRTKRRFDEAAADLDRIGDGLSVLPELAERVLLLKRMWDALRDQAAKAGVVLRYEDEVFAAAELFEEDDDLDEETTRSVFSVPGEPRPSRARPGRRRRSPQPAGSTPR